MKKNSSNTHKIPVILVDQTSVTAFHIFNPNDWDGVSKSIVSSCAAQYGLLTYSVKKLDELFGNSNKLCLPKFRELKNQWRTSKWPIDKCNYLAEIPEVHLFIQVFLNSIKTFLDLLVQLISSENIVYKKIHGFHKKRKDPGGELLHALKKKARNKEVADSLFKLVSEHKRKWIDDAVKARDSMAHPEKGLTQVMLQLEIKPKNSELELTAIKKPTIGTTDFNKWADEILENLSNFSKSFTEVIKAHNQRLHEDRS